MKILNQSRWKVVFGLLLLAGLPALAVSVPMDPSRDAFAILERLTGFGNRYAGAPKRRQAIRLLNHLLKERGLQVAQTPFDSPDPKSGKIWDMVNLVGRLHPAASCRFILGTHFDTRHVAEEDADPQKRTQPIEGANDGTSGVAVLLALAPRLSAILPKRVGVDIVFLDGEEMGYPDVGGYYAGSKHFASQLTSLKTKPRFGIILDMVCAPGGIYKIDPYSEHANPALLDVLWSIGAKADPQAFSRDRWPRIVDDHVPISQAGVPSLLLIGMNYPQWHTSEDTVSRCSPKRLELIVKVLEDFIRAKLPEFMEGCR